MSYSLSFEHEGQFVVEDDGATFLQTALAQGIPHEHACGGNARCSTCRVLVLDGLENICERNTEECDLARKKGLEPNVRLACQSTARGPVRLRRLVLDADDLKEASSQSGGSTGREENIAVLFSDIRSFTNFSEKHLPYDVIHSLNRYFLHMGQCVLDQNGRIDKYMGDGLMALFGLEEGDGRTICLSAVKAALKMRAALTQVNEYLKIHLNETFVFGIGIHYGSALVGVLGHPEFRQFTAIGDTVNMASRIESVTKKAGADLLISEEVYELIRDDVILGRKFVTGLKGKSGKYRLYEIKGLKEAAPEVVSSTITAVESPDMVQTADLDAEPMPETMQTEIIPETRVLPTDGRKLFTGLFMDKLEMSRDTLTFRIHLKETFPFVAGQAVDVRLPSGESRILSIASAPGQPLLFATRMRDSAFKKELLSLKSGTEVSVSSPMGGFKAEEAASLFILAGGIGMTPFRSIVEEMINLSEKRKPVTFLYAVRFLEEAVFLDLLESWALELADFRFEVFASKSRQVDQPYHAGTITGAAIQEYLRADDSFLIAGSPRFVKGMQTLIKELNLDSMPVYTERFAGY